MYFQSTSHERLDFRKFNDDLQQQIHDVLSFQTKRRKIKTLHERFSFTSRPSNFCISLQSRVFQTVLEESTLPKNIKKWFLME